MKKHIHLTINTGLEYRSLYSQIVVYYSYREITLKDIERIIFFNCNIIQKIWLNVYLKP